jgi:hypothetical protein
MVPQLDVSGGQRVDGRLVPRLSDRTAALVAATVSRLAVFVAGFGAAKYLRYPGQRRAASHGLRGLLSEPWLLKDATWFISIARHGYADKHDATAFFPLYPLLVRLVALPTDQHYLAAGVILSLACYAGAMIALYCLAADVWDTRVAAITVMFISVFPTALVFNAVYSESLFLLLTVGCLLAAEREHWLLAGLAGLLACLTRSAGLLLLLPLLLIYARQRGWTWRHVSLSWPRDRRLASLLLVPMGLLVSVAYLWWRFGQPLLFLSAERHRWGRRLDWPFVDVWRCLQSAGHTLSYLAASHSHLFAVLRPDHHAASLVAMSLFPLAALVFAVVAIVVGWRRLPPPYTAYAAVAAAFPLFFPTPIYPMFSFHRFVLMAFPLFMAVALVTRKHAVVRWSLLAVSFVLMLWLTGHFAIDANAV